MSGFAPLLALDIVLLFKVAIPLIAAFIWLLNQVLAKAKQAPPRPGGAPPPQRRPAAKAVEDEVEAFLRRAAQARSGQGPGAAPPPQKPAARAGLGKPLPPMQPSAARRPPPLPATAVEVVPERIGSEGVAAHVARHLDSSGFTSRAGQLTQLDQADEQMEEHIHQSLDHRLGQLAPVESAVAASTATGGSVPETPGLAAFLANPQNMRSAFIFSEVLRRPEV